MTENRGEAVATKSRLFVGSIEKGMKVLMTFAGNSELRLSDVAQLSGLDKSASQRFLFTLTALGYLQQNPTTKYYTLSPKILGLVQGYSEHSLLVQRAMPHLITCSQQAQESVNLGALDGTKMIYTACIKGPHRLNVNYYVGDSYEIHCSGGGLALLSAMTPGRAREILDQIELTRHTQYTMTDKEAILQRLAAAHERGYVIAQQEYYIGNMSTAAPVIDNSGDPVAAVNISAPTARWTLEEVEQKLAPLAVKTAKAISREIQKVDDS